MLNKIFDRLCWRWSTAAEVHRCGEANIMAPGPGLINTSFAERQNLTKRMSMRGSPA